MDVNIHPMRPEDTDGKGFVHWKMPAAGRKTPSSSG